MAGKFVDLQEAATMLGLSQEEVVDMRSKGDIFGYRDGASWKFKTEEVQRVIRERGVEGRSGGESGVLSANDEDFENLITGLSSKILAEKAQEESESESGSVLISEQELGVSSTGQSTIIGKGKDAEKKAAESDLRLASDSDLRLDDSQVLGGGSDKLIEAPGNKLDSASASDVLHGSDLNITTGSGTGDMPGPRPGSTGALKANDAIQLGDDDDQDSDSALDEELLPKKGSGIGSDVTLGSGDSGINLAPSDSGLSLEEEPLDLGGSGIDQLELPDEDDVIAVQTEEGADPDVGTQVKADNEFLLSAGEGMTDDDSDSGSQVIALEDSESFDQEAATMLKSEPAAAALEEDAFQPIGVETGFGAPAPGVVAAPSYVQVTAAEAPYSVWNVISLGVVAGTLALAGMMMVDVMLNMWVYSGTNGLSSGIMDAFLSMVGMGA